MSRQPGFVPIPFHIVGKILLTLGAIGAVVVAILRVVLGYPLPIVVTLFSLVAIIVGLYLIYIIPREPLE